MSPTERHTVEAYHHTCLRCERGATEGWWSFNAKPGACCYCKSKQWDTPRTRAPRATKGAIRQRAWRKRVKENARREKREARAAARAAKLSKGPVTGDTPE